LNYLVIDCRSEAEYQGGHIKGAINVSSKEQLLDFFFEQSRIEHLMKSQTVLVFHCEFSERRAPGLYSILRGVDREMNHAYYPRLFYPEIYVLKGGYSEFWRSYPGHCNGAYTKMEGNFSYNHKTRA
jgi:M-phase inducer tyrosine phosphatase